MYGERLSFEGVSYRHPNGGSFHDANKWTWYLQRLSFDSKGSDRHSDIVIAVRMPDAVACFETNGQSPIDKRPCRNAVVIERDCLK
jgi:hypothetical protein